MKFTFIRYVPAGFQLRDAPELAEHMRKVNDPQDLNEALISVCHDAAVASLKAAIEAKHDELFCSLFFPPPPAP